MWWQSIGKMPRGSPDPVTQNTVILPEEAIEFLSQFCSVRGRHFTGRRPSLLYTSQGDFDPEGRLIIAQRFRDSPVLLAFWVICSWDWQTNGTVSGSEAESCQKLNRVSAAHSAGMIAISPGSRRATRGFGDIAHIRPRRGRSRCL
jgi:hypothetical protein